MKYGTVAVFNPAAGVGTTTLVYHLAWMLSDLGVRTLTADFDPQARLTAAFAGGERAAGVDPDPPLYGAFGYRPPEAEAVSDSLAHLRSDSRFMRLEEELAREWHGGAEALPRHAAVWGHLEASAAAWEADVLLLDAGPNLGALQRAALLAAGHLITPLAPSGTAMEGIRQYAGWRAEWEARRPDGRDAPRPLGYVLMRRPLRLDRPGEDAGLWESLAPQWYRTYVLGQSEAGDDGSRLGLLKAYFTLLDMARDAGKPVFHLKPADGAMGAYLSAAREVETAYRGLAETLLARLSG